MFKKNSKDNNNRSDMNKVIDSKTVILFGETYEISYLAKPVFYVALCDVLLHGKKVLELYDKLGLSDEFWNYLTKKEISPATPKEKRNW